MQATGGWLSTCTVACLLRPHLAKLRGCGAKLLTGPKFYRFGTSVYRIYFPTLKDTLSSVYKKRLFSEREICTGPLCPSDPPATRVKYTVSV